MISPATSALVCSVTSARARATSLATTRCDAAASTPYALSFASAAPTAAFPTFGSSPSLGFSSSKSDAAIRYRTKLPSIAPVFGCRNVTTSPWKWTGSSRSAAPFIFSTVTVVHFVLLTPSMRRITSKSARYAELSRGPRLQLCRKRSVNGPEDRKEAVTDHN